VVLLYTVVDQGKCQDEPPDELKPVPVATSTWGPWVPWKLCIRNYQTRWRRCIPNKDVIDPLPDKEDGGKEIGGKPGVKPKRPWWKKPGVKPKRPWRPWWKKWKCYPGKPYEKRACKVSVTWSDWGPWGPCFKSWNHQIRKRWCIYGDAPEPDKDGDKDDEKEPEDKPDGKTGGKPDGLGKPGGKLGGKSGGKPGVKPVRPWKTYSKWGCSGSSYEKQPCEGIVDPDQKEKEENKTKPKQPKWKRERE